MNVTVDDARQKEKPPSNLPPRREAFYCCYTPIFNEDGCLVALALIYNGNVLYRETACFHFFTLKPLKPLNFLNFSSPLNSYPLALFLG
jgi:hypothetical protein